MTPVRQRLVDFIDVGPLNATTLPVVEPRWGIFSLGDDVDKAKCTMRSALKPDCASQVKGFFGSDDEEACCEGDGGKYITVRRRAILPRGDDDKTGFCISKWPWRALIAMFIAAIIVGAGWIYWSIKHKASGGVEDNDDDASSNEDEKPRGRTRTRSRRRRSQSESRSPPRKSRSRRR